MENQFVPFELAVKLKELGFDDKCFMYYFKLLRHEFEDFRSSSKITFNEDEPIKLLTFSNDEFCKIQCGAPLWQQAFDFVMDILTITPGYYQTHIIYISNNMMTVKTDTGRQTGKQFHSRTKCLEYLISLCK